MPSPFKTVVKRLARIMTDRRASGHRHAHQAQCVAAAYSCRFGETGGHVGRRLVIPVRYERGGRRSQGVRRSRPDHRVGGRAVSFVVALVSLSAVSAACGGGSTGKVAVDQYVESLCAAEGPLQTALPQSSIDAADPSAGPKARDIVLKLIDTERAANGKIDGAGYPDVDNGKVFAQDFRRTLALITQGYSSLRPDAEHLATLNGSALSQALDTLSTKLDDAFSGLKADAALNPTARSQIETAMKLNVTCKKYGLSSLN